MEKRGKVVKGLGGLYVTRIVDGDSVSYLSSYAKGNLKRDDEKILIGDNVVLTVDEDTPDSVVISEILDRKNSLIRPPLANLDYLFIVFAAKKPSPVIETVDKLIAIAEHNNIEPVIVVTKEDMDKTLADEYVSLYKKVGLDAFSTSSKDVSGINELSKYINDNLRDGRSAAFAGASGVGKSTLMNTLFPSLTLATAEISQKIERGRHTTRHVEIFEIGEGCNAGLLADTPGFSLIDFERFDFFELDDLISTFRDLRPYALKCKYSDCSHVGEGSDECAVMKAVTLRNVAESRLESYRSIYRTLYRKSQDYTKNK